MNSKKYSDNQSLVYHHMFAKLDLLCNLCYSIADENLFENIEYSFLLLIILLILPTPSQTFLAGIVCLGYDDEMA